MRRLKTGDRFGDLELVSFVSKKARCGTSRRIWTCRCVCGGATIVENRNLIRYPDRICEHVDAKERIESLLRKNDAHQT
jgi:hypothetical protein